VRRRSVALAATAVVALLAAAPAAQAFEVKVPTAAPADTKAGQHSDVKLRIEPSGGQIKDVDIHFPPGLVGDPHATNYCTIAQFEANSCPEETKVGTSNTEATVLGLPQTLAGTIYNVTPRGTEPALLGIIIRPPVGEPIRLESPVTSRTTDGGLDSTLRNIPNTFAGMDITIQALDVTLLGKTSTGRFFMQNPTSCGPANTVVDAKDYDGNAASASGGFESVACRELPFAPTFTAVVGATGQTGAGTNPPLTTVVGQSPGEANAKRVSVLLPPEIAIAANRLARACPQDQFDAGTCPPTAQIGNATAITPLLTGPLTGPVSFVAGSGLPELVLSLRGPLSLTLRGVTEFTSNGVRTTFSGIPDVPLSRFELTFLGGEQGVLAASRDLCLPPAPVVSATFLSHAGTESTVTPTATVAGCTGTTTPPATTRRRPTATLRLGALRNGRPSLNLLVSGRDGAAVKRVRLGLPRGMSVAKRTKLRGAKLLAKRRVIQVTARGTGTRRVRLRLGVGTLAVAQRLRTAKRLRFVLRVTEGSGRRTTRRVSVKPRS
jgi:hypothetical protein